MTETALKLLPDCEPVTTEHESEQAQKTEEAQAMPELSPGQKQVVRTDIGVILAGITISTASFLLPGQERFPVFDDEYFRKHPDKLKVVESYDQFREIVERAKQQYLTHLDEAEINRWIDGDRLQAVRRIVFQDLREQYPTIWQAHVWAIDRALEQAQRELDLPLSLADREAGYK